MSLISFGNLSTGLDLQDEMDEGMDTNLGTDSTKPSEKGIEKEFVKLKECT